MRKRVVIATFALVLAAGLVYVFADFGPDTIEHHTKGYRAQRNWNGFERWIDKRAPRFISGFLHEWKFKRKLHHLQRLVRLGFLQHETIAVVNASPTEVMLKASVDNPAIDPNPEFFEQFTFNAQPNVIHTYAKPVDMKLWTNLIRSADVPAAKLAL